MELIGAYCRITVGRTVGEGLVEIKINEEETAESVPISEVGEHIARILA
jgi:prolyl-tRNA synthetase